MPKMDHMETTIARSLLSVQTALFSSCWIDPQAVCHRQAVAIKANLAGCIG